jgi:hypothetical protein
MGATTGKARTDASDAFARLQSNAVFRRQLLAQARARITTMELARQRHPA